MGLFKTIIENVRSGSIDKIEIDANSIMQFELFEEPLSFGELNNTRNPPPSVSVILKIWGNEQILKIKNPVGMPLEGEGVFAWGFKSKKEYVTMIQGKTTGILIKEGNIPEKRIVHRTVTINISGIVKAYKKIDFKKREKYTPGLIEALKGSLEEEFLGGTSEYMRGYQLKSEALHKFIILTSNKIFYAVDYVGDLITPVILNDQITITKGKIDLECKVIEANEIQLSSSVTSKKVDFPLFENEFQSIETIKGKIFEVSLAYCESSRYKDWLLKRSSLGRRDPLIEEFRDFYKEYCLESGTKEFLLPYYIINLIIDGNKKLVVVFRPVWFIEESLMFYLLSFPCFKENDELELRASVTESGMYISESIHNKTQNTQAFSIVNFTNNDVQIASTGENKIVGTIIDIPITLCFGVDPERLKHHPMLISLVENTLSQVIFNVVTVDNKLISCKSSINLIKYGREQWLEQGTPIQRIANMKVRLKGNFTPLGIFVVEEFLDNSQEGLDVN